MPGEEAANGGIPPVPGEGAQSAPAPGQEVKPDAGAPVVPQEMVEGAHHPVDEPAEAAGEAAPQGADIEGSTPIPVSDGDENNFPDRIDDPALAYEMAKAGEENRGAAAEERVEIGQNQAARDALMEDLSARPDTDEATTTLDERTRKAAFRSQKLEAAAEAKEEWARILHEMPIDEGYRALHPDVDFSPRGLFSLEADERLERAEIQRKEASLAAMSGADALRGVIPQGEDQAPTHYSVEDMLTQYAGDEETYTRELQAWRDLTGNEQTTLGEVKDFFESKYNEYVLAAARAKVSIITDLLEDVRSGRAAQEWAVPTGNS